MRMFAYKRFEEGLDAFIESVGRPEATRALRKLKFMVLATAWVDFQSWHPDTDQEQAIAWAWEDMQIAFSGYGDSALTGAVVNLWTAVPEDRWDEGLQVINTAVMRANDETPKTVARRYLLHYRVQTARTPRMGYDLPAIVPVTGPAMREWAESVGMNPDAAEAQMMLVEEYERMGLIKLGQEDLYVQKGGAKVSAGSEAMMNPEAVGPPKLRLVADED